MLNNLVSSDTEFTKKAVEGFTNVLESIKEKHSEEIKSLEMQTAFGTKKQQQTADNTQENIDDPMGKLGEMLQQFN